jgi:hypothetical protein
LESSFDCIIAFGSDESVVVVQSRGTFIFIRRIPFSHWLPSEVLSSMKEMLSFADKDAPAISVGVLYEPGIYVPSCSRVFFISHRFLQE